MTANLLRLLKSNAIYADVRGNPVAKNVEEGVAAYKAGGHDGVIAFGGGSALDVGKAIAFMAGQTRPMWDFEDIGDWWTRADPDGIAPVVAVPTTAGTGSEVGRASVITNEETHEKKIIFHPKMMPVVVISDAELSVGLPPHITAATGMDAFTHCFEAYLSPGFHPLADGVALNGMLLIKDALPIAVADGSNIEARQKMLAAASMGATAFQKGLGAVHSIAHPLSAHYDTHHGLANAILLPYVTAFNMPAIEEKLKPLARLLDLPGGDGKAVLDWIVAFRKQLGIAHTLAEIGIPDDKADIVGRDAFRDPSTGSNARAITETDMTRIFRAARIGDFAMAVG
jgi:alcohol dehydrogenase class IV